MVEGRQTILGGRRYRTRLANIRLQRSAAAQLQIYNSYYNKYNDCNDYKDDDYVVHFCRLCQLEGECFFLMNPFSICMHGDLSSKDGNYLTCSQPPVDLLE